MIQRGLYVDVWREGFKDRQQADELIAFCHAAGITDLFVHMHKDIVSISIEWDYMRYLLDNKGPWNVHGWFSGLQLGSNNTWTRSVYPENTRMASQNVLFLDPTVREARETLISKIENFASKYPDAYGIHLDKMRYPVFNHSTPGRGDNQKKKASLLALMQSLRSVFSAYRVSMVITQVMLELESHGCCNWKQWKQSGLIDDVTVVMEMMNEQELEERLEALVPDYASVVIPCYMLGFNSSIRKINIVRASGHGHCILSYGMCAFDNRERSAFAGMLSHGVG